MVKGGYYHLPVMYYGQTIIKQLILKSSFKRFIRQLRGSTYQT